MSSQNVKTREESVDEQVMAYLENVKADLAMEYSSVSATKDESTGPERTTATAPSSVSKKNAKKYAKKKQRKKMQQQQAASSAPPEPQYEANVCAKCGKAAAKAKCSKCKSVYYCSRSCQTTHWKSHKPVCQQITERVSTLRMPQ